MRDFKKLKVWERSYGLTLAVYEATATFPREEMYSLTSQIRRSCAAIPANIAEGCGRDSNSDLARFLQRRRWDRRPNLSAIFSLPAISHFWKWQTTSVLPGK